MIELSTEQLQEFVVAQRWFGSKSRTPSQISFCEDIPIREADPRLDLMLVEVAFDEGTHELYQLPVGERPEATVEPEGIIHSDGKRVLYDAVTDPALISEIARLMKAGAEVTTENGVARFVGLEGFDVICETVRSLGVEQSNSSVVLDEKVVLKVLRRLGPGINPELEMLRFLSEHGFAHIPALRGYYEHSGGQLDATLGVVQDYVPGSKDGWAIALADLSSGEPMRFEESARRLGEITGELHATLGSDNHDPAFAPADTSVEALGLLTATVDEEIERIFRDLPEDDPALDDVRGRGQEIRDRLSTMTQVGSVGRAIRHHGDYHLGQVLRGESGEWAILDFEGEPARSLVERRGKRSPLRDVAGMLRSFAYAASASQIQNGVVAPAEWETTMRDAFVAGYMTHVDQTLLPAGRAAVERMIAIFELEKIVYELRYELDHRPDWVGIPVAGIRRLLDPTDAEEASS